MTAVVMATLVDVVMLWLPALAVVASIIVAAFGFGQLALHLLGPLPGSSPADRRLFSVGLGLGLLALLVLALGLAGWLSALTLTGLLAVGAAGGLAMVAAGTTTVAAAGPPPLSDHAVSEQPVLRAALIVSLTGAAGVIGLGVLMPEFFHDALIYHLELPRYYLHHHTISFLPWNYNSALPANVEMLYLIALAFADERATRLIHAGLAGLCVVTLWKLGEAVAGHAQTGRLAGLLFLTTPAVALLATVSGNDFGLAAFELLSLLAWLRWRSAADHRWLALSALLMGCALGTKYSALFFLSGFALAWVVLVWQSSSGRAGLLRAAGAWLLIAAIAASPWYVKNLLLTGDPFHPVFAAHLHQPFMDEVGAHLLRRDLGSGGAAPSLWAGALSRLIANDIGWLTAAAAIGATLLAGRLPSIRPLLPFAAGSLLAWYFISPVPRYLLPTVALLALIAAVALLAPASGRRTVRIASGIAIALALALQWHMAVTLLRDTYTAPFTAETGLTAVPRSDQQQAPSYGQLIRDGPARSQWLAWSVPPFAIMEEANRRLPPSARVLFVGEYRGYYLERDRIIGSKYNVAPLIRWAAEAATPDGLLARLRDEGVTHIIYNQIETRRLEQSGYPAFRWPDERSRGLFEQLRREGLTLLKVENGVFLYTVDGK